MGSFAFSSGQGKEEAKAVVLNEAVAPNEAKLNK